MWISWSWFMVNESAMAAATTCDFWRTGGGRFPPYRSSPYFRQTLLPAISDPLLPVIRRDHDGDGPEYDGDVVHSLISND
jgi:hypothetical protein